MTFPDWYDIGKRVTAIFYDHQVSGVVVPYDFEYEVSEVKTIFAVQLDDGTEIPFHELSLVEFIYDELED